MWGSVRSREEGTVRESDCGWPWRHWDKSLGSDHNLGEGTGWGLKLTPGTCRDRAQGHIIAGWGLILNSSSVRRHIQLPSFPRNAHLTLLLPPDPAPSTQHPHHTNYTHSILTSHGAALTSPGWTSRSLQCIGHYVHQTCFSSMWVQKQTIFSRIAFKPMEHAGNDEYHLWAWTLKLWVQLSLPSLISHLPARFGESGRKFPGLRGWHSLKTEPGARECPLSPPCLSKLDCAIRNKPLICEATESWGLLVTADRPFWLIHPFQGCHETCSSLYHPPCRPGYISIFHKKYLLSHWADLLKERNYLTFILCFPHLEHIVYRCPH